MAASDEEFLTALQDCFGYRLGKLQKVGERHAYPLALTTSTEQVRRNLVVLGNAAHSLHPVAGQGFNLSLRDVAVLADVLGYAGPPARISLHWRPWSITSSSNWRTSRTP